jgi:hypothetical protein
LEIRRRWWDRQRYRQVNNFTGTTTIYVEGLFDREVTGALVKDVHYWDSPLLVDTLLS